MLLENFSITNSKLHQGVFAVGSQFYYLTEDHKNENQLIQLVSKIKSNVYKLTELPIGWDGYEGVPVSTESAKFAV